jgi:DNA invertase Pin-like site-specific DNA recombinase
MLIGYARVSTSEQDTAAQVAALKADGCERIFREKASGGRWDRPELHRLLDQLRKGDVLVVWKLDRLSRSLRDVLVIMERLADAKAGFRSLTEAIDTTTPAGRMMMQHIRVGSPSPAFISICANLPVRISRGVEAVLPSEAAPQS